MDSQSPQPNSISASTPSLVTKPTQPGDTIIASTGLAGTGEASVGSTGTAEWPTVPPAPTLVKVEPPVAPEPPVLTAPTPVLTSTPPDRSTPTPAPVTPAAVTPPATTPPGSTPAAVPQPASTPAAGSTAPATPAVVTPTPVLAAAGSGGSASPADDDSPTVPISTRAVPTPSTITPTAAPTATSTASRQRSRRPAPVAKTLPAEESPVLQLQRTVRRQQALARDPREHLVWQPRFAYSSGLVVLAAFTVVSLPLWIVLYRTVGAAEPEVADIMALCMMLLGGMLTCAAAWVIIVEMRGRVRMVDTLARTGDREAMALPELPVLDAPIAPAAPVGPSALATTQLAAARAPDRSLPEPLTWEESNAALAARAEAQQRHATQTLEASSKLLGSFGVVLKSFGQLHAQVAMLVVALALFAGATILSLR